MKTVILISQILILFVFTTTTQFTSVAEASDIVIAPGDSIFVGSQIVRCSEDSALCYCAYEQIKVCQSTDIDGSCRRYAWEDRFYLKLTRPSVDLGTYYTRDACAKDLAIFAECRH